MTDRINAPRPRTKSRHLLRRMITLALLVFATGSALLPLRDAAAGTDTAHATAALDALAIAFEENRGQFVEGADYGARSAGFGVLFDQRGALINARRADGSAWRLRLRPTGAAADREPRAENQQPGQVHYYKGKDPANWHTGIRTWSQIRYAAVYPGVDLIYRGYGDRIEYDFVVAPGADPSVVSLAIDGADFLALGDDGALIAHSGHDQFRIAAPYLYQATETGLKEISGAFRITAQDRVEFDVGRYDRKRELIIDPVLLGYSTRHGGSGVDEPREIVVDDNGFIYVAGGTRSADFAGAGGAAADKDVFVSKITPDGQTLIYTTLIGDSGTEDAVGLDVDDQGHAYVAGQTESISFPTVNAFDSTRGGDADYFIARLDARGLIAYSSLYGGEGRDGEFDGGLALGSGDIAYITGRTASLPPNGLPLVNAYETTCAVATCAFAAGFDTRQIGAASLVYSTYIGGDSDEGGKSIDVDASDHLYIFGFTGSDTQLIDPTQGFQPLSADVANNDTFLMKLDPGLSGANQLLYSTYMSGPDDESEDGQVIAGDNGIAWVVGATSSVAGPLGTDFPNKNAMQTQNAGSQDAFVMKIDTLQTGGNSLLFATFVGASGNEGATSIALDLAQNIYLAINTSSFDFPVVAPIAAFLPFSPPDPMLVHLDASAMTIETATPMPGVDRLTTAVNGDIYIAGRTQTSVFPLVSPLPPSPIGSNEIFLGRVTGRPLSGITLQVEDTGDPVATGETFAYRYTMTNHGNDTINGLTLTSDLPSALTIGLLPAVCFFNGPDMECMPNDLATTPLAPGQNLTWFVPASSAVSGDFSVTTTNVTTMPADPDNSDNSDTETMTVDATGSTPPGTLTLSDFDATGLSFDIGGFMLDTPRGVLATPNGSLDEAASFMIFDGSIALHIRDIWSQGRVAFGLVERNAWTPAPFDGGSLFAPEALAHRVYAQVDDEGHVELRSAPPFGPGILIDEAFVGLDPAKAFSITLSGSTASVFYAGDLIAQGNPYQSGGASQGQVGDDFVISIGLGNEFLGAALIDRQAPAASASATGGGIPSNPQVCSQTTFNPSPRRDPAGFGWTTFNTGAVNLDWSTSDDIELCGGGVVPAGNLTGGSGDAACIDTDVVGPGVVESYLCSPQIDLTNTADPDLQFRLAYQIANTEGSEDAFEVLVGSDLPSAATIGAYDVLQTISDDVGVFGSNGEVQNLQLTPGAPLHVCFRYAADYDWYAQIDDVTISAKDCSGPAWGDSDADGISDEFDNCTDLANPTQLDSDGDGIGNLCDADFNGDCLVNVVDLGIMKQNFFASGDLPTDLNGDNQTNAIDLGLLKQKFFGDPGPSGVAASCASSMCEGTYNAFTDGTIFMIGDRSVIGFWGVEICPGSTTLGDGSDWNLVPTTCRCN